MGDIIYNIGSSSSSIRPANGPVITVADNTTVDTGSTFVAPVADAKNWNGKDISYTVDDSAVNMSAAGTYLITYTAIDTMGRTTVESRNIIVQTPMIPAHYYMVAEAGGGTFVKFRFEQDFAYYSNLSNVDTVMAERDPSTGSTQKQWSVRGSILKYTQSAVNEERKISHLLEFTAEQPGVSAELQTPGGEVNWMWSSSNDLIGSSGTDLTFVPEAPA